MDSTPIPVLSESDPAAVTTIAVAPVCEPASQPSGAATNTPEKKVDETGAVATGDELISTAVPNISSSAPPDINSMVTKLPVKTRIVNLKRDREDASDDGVGLDSARKLLEEDKSRLLTSVENDPDEKMAATEAEDLNWRWPSYDEVFDQSGNLSYAKRGKAFKLTTKGSPFQVIYRSARDLVLWPDRVQIKLKSPHLMAILSEYLPEEKDLQYLDKLDLNGSRVYGILDKLKEHKFDDGDENSANISAGLQPSENGVHQDVNLGTDISDLHSKDVTSEGKNHTAGSTMKEARLHLYHLVRFMDDEYKLVALKHKRMTEDKCVSFDMLWAFLAPGTTVVYHCSYTQEQLCAKVSGNGYQQTQCGKIFSVTLAVWDYNGVAYRQCTIARAIGAFSGEAPFDTLGVRPIDMDRTTPAHVLEAEFMAKGRRFQELAMDNSNCFMHYTGPTFRVRRNEIVKERANGRVMIDLRSFAVMNPNFPMRNAQPPVSPGSDEKDHMRAYNTSVRAAHFEAHRSRVINRRGGRPVQSARMKLPACDSMEEPGPAFAEKPFIETENLIFAPAIVFGFSFILKQWGAFAVTGFSEIEFDTNAFHALVMEPEHKGLLYSLVSQFIATPTTNTGPSMENMPRVDPIANKGEGCIFLCYGPPGTGKTLTAESLAENLRRPLWALSVAELGTTPSDLERTLLRVLDIAAMWKAVLLLDEADVYLEKRVAAADLTRNAMTGVFMRLLEYYRGVLFLTTNRITTFDDAFRSRISLVLCYPKLNKDRRLQIWSAALGRVQAGKGEEVKVSPDFLVEMARQKMNGREIRNAIHTAQTLARSKNEDLQEQHLRFVMRVITKTSDILDANLRDP